MIRVSSVKLLRTPHLPSLLGDDLGYLWKPLHRQEGIAGWGLKRSGRIARRFSAQTSTKLLLLEDGFLRSITLGHAAPPLSVVLDDVGMYYDATSPSRLEELISARGEASALQRARRLAELWRIGRLSKYNHCREMTPPVPGGYVLVVDQTSGDASIEYGLADSRSFRRMLEAAIDEYPGWPIVLKVHPDVIAGRKRGHFEILSKAQRTRVTVLSNDAHPPSLLESAKAVYTVTSQMGFEALIWGKPVRTFGMPFYAGWGLTNDDLPRPERRRTRHQVTLENLVYAALVEYPRYLDPETGQRCEPERLMQWMALQRRMRERFPAKVQAVAFSRWKKPIVRAFLSGSEVRFTRRIDSAPEPGAAVAVWGLKSEPQLRQAAQEKASTPIIRLEDGFLRSVGLGADLVRPVSWVTDDQGIYYDATQPSRLETILRETQFDAATLERARALRKRIVDEGFTKFNVGSTSWQRPQRTERIVLVAGQVEDDASIRYGAPGLRTNMGLLRAVREARPDAHLIYKPHPDVVAGLRAGGDGEENARRWCDEIVRDVPIHVLLDAADEIHVLTSLAGFEGLLRGKAVVTYGCPFYSGWGLTKDVATAPQVWQRRGRPLMIDELVAGALIYYPTYISRTTGAFTTPERALDELAEWRRKGARSLPTWRRTLRPILGFLARFR